MNLKFLNDNKNEDEFKFLQKELKESSQINFRSLLSGSLLSSDKFFRQLPFLLYLTLLGLIYISANYENKLTYKKLSQSKKELEELHNKSMQYQIELNKVDRPSMVAIRVKKIGLKPISGPVTKIIIER